MIIEIIKEHVNGLSVGLVQDFTQNVAIKLIRDGYAIEATNEQLIEYRKSVNEIISARSRMMKQRIEDNIIEKEKEAAEKKNSDADAKPVVSDIEAVKAEYFDLGVQQGTEDGMKEGFAKGYELGHAGGYKQGYDSCLAEMANNIFPEPETEPKITGSQTEIEQEITVNEPESELEDDKISDLPKLQNVEETETLTVQAEPAKPKRGKPTTK